MGVIHAKFLLKLYVLVNDNSPTFDFAAYLYENLGESCWEIVEVEPRTWVFFMYASLIIYLIAVILRDNLHLMRWIWLGLGYLTTMVSLAFSFYYYDTFSAFSFKSLSLAFTFTIDCCIFFLISLFSSI